MIEFHMIYTAEIAAKMDLNSLHIFPSFNLLPPYTEVTDYNTEKVPEKRHFRSIFAAIFALLML